MEENKRNCNTCLGKKYVIGMGCINVDCPECKGKGYIFDSDIIEKSIDKNSLEIHTVSEKELSEIDTSNLELLTADYSIPKKKGRPKKL